MQKISSNQIFILLLVFLLGIFLTIGIYQVKAIGRLAPGGGGVLSPGFFTLDANGAGIQPSNTLFTIGTEETPWLEGNFTTLNATNTNITNLTISGASAGDLDMGGFDITNGGTITGATLSATSTLTVSGTASTTIIDLGIGDVSAPSLSFDGANSGLYREADGHITFSGQGASIVDISRTGTDRGLTISSEGSLFWADNTNAGLDSPDIDLNRLSANILQLASGDSFVTVDGAIGVATTSPTDDFAVQDSTGTSTIHIGTLGQTDQGSCIQLYSPNGDAARIYWSNENTLISEEGDCEE